MQSTTLSNQFKPAILKCFGDIAQAIGGHFETYLSVVSQVLQQAATVTASPEGSYDMLEYVISLREGIMDAWGGIVLAMKAGGKSEVPMTATALIDLLTCVSSTTATLCGAHLPAAAHRVARSEQKRRTDALRHGRDRVSAMIHRGKTALTAAVIWPRRFPMASTPISTAPIGSRI